MGGAGPEEDEEQRLIEERRRRRAEILARHRAQGAGGAVAAERPPNDAAMRSVEQPAADAARQPADRPMADAAPQSAGAEPERAPRPRPAAADPSDDEEAVLGSIMKEGDDLLLFRSDEDGDARLDDSKLVSRGMRGLQHWWRHQRVTTFHAGSHGPTHPAASHP